MPPKINKNNCHCICLSLECAYHFVCLALFFSPAQFLLFNWIFCLWPKRWRWCCFHWIISITNNCYGYLTFVFHAGHSLWVSHSLAYVWVFLNVCILWNVCVCVWICVRRLFMVNILWNFMPFFLFLSKGVSCVLFVSRFNSTNWCWW